MPQPSHGCPVEPPPSLARAVTAQGDRRNTSILSPLHTLWGKRPCPTWEIKTNQIVVRNVLLSDTVCISYYSKIVMNRYCLDSWDLIYFCTT